MADLVDQYLNKMAVKNHSACTLKGYGLDLRQAERAIAKPPVRATADDLEAFVASLSRSRLKGNTIRRKQPALRGFFGICLRQRVLKTDFTALLDAPKVEERLPIYLNSAQVAAVLKVVEVEMGEAPPSSCAPRRSSSASTTQGCAPSNWPG